MESTVTCLCCYYDSLFINFIFIKFFFFFQFELGLRNFKAEQPHQHALYYTSYVLEEMAWHKDELIEALEGKLIGSILKITPKAKAKQFSMKMNA
jgi:hypothetical protein